MAGEQTRILWALVYMIGLFATNLFVQNGFSETLAWGIWIVVILVSTWSIGRSWGKKMPEPVEKTWRMAMGLFLVLAVAFLAGVLPASGAAVLAVYFFIFGATRLATGLEIKMMPAVAMGLMEIAFGFVTTSWFANDYFLAAAFIIGIPMLINNWKA